MSDPVPSVTPYQMTINNCSDFMKREVEKSSKSRSDITAFDISEVLAIAFCTNKEKVMADLLAAYKIKS